MEQYQGSQVSGTEVHKKPEETDNLLNSSAETLPNIPKTPDTSFENKPQGTKSGAGVTPAEARLELGGKRIPTQRDWEQEGGYTTSEVR